MDTYYSYLERWEASQTNDYLTTSRKYYMDRYCDIDWTYDIEHDRNLLRPCILILDTRQSLGMVVLL